MAMFSPEQLVTIRTAPTGRSGNRLRVAFALAEARQADAVEQTGLSAPTISNLVAGAYKVLDIENARKLADYFGCVIEDLFPARVDALNHETESAAGAAAAQRETEGEASSESAVTR